MILLHFKEKAGADTSIAIFLEQQYTTELHSSVHTPILWTENDYPRLPQ